MSLTPGTRPNITVRSDLFDLNAKQFGINFIQNLLLYVINLSKGDQFFARMEPKKKISLGLNVFDLEDRSSWLRPEATNSSALGTALVTVVTSGGRTVQRVAEVKSKQPHYFCIHFQHKIVF